VTYIDELKSVIRKLHGVEATHVESVPIKEVFQGSKVVWDGVVEVFDLHGHPTAKRLYAWTHQTDDPKHPSRSVTVLHLGGITSPLKAVQAAIVQELRASESSEAEQA
jgi:hypothetical protein